MYFILNLSSCRNGGEKKENSRSLINSDREIDCGRFKNLAPSIDQSRADTKRGTESNSSGAGQSGG